MKKSPLILMIVFILLLAACSADKKETESSGVPTSAHTRVTVSSTAEQTSSTIIRADTTSASAQTLQTVIETAAAAASTDTKAATTTTTVTTSATKMPQGELAALSAFDLNGNAVNASIFNGKKLTMINVWATYCQPCIAEMPDLGEINSEYKDNGFQIIGIVSDAINYNGQPFGNVISEAKDIIDLTDASYLHIMPSDSVMELILKDVTGVPTTFFVDENGNFVGESYTGMRSKNEWIQIIDQLLAKS